MKQSRDISPEERLDWLRLIRTPKIGPIRFYQLLNRYGSVKNALEALPELASSSGSTNPRIPSISQIKAEITANMHYGATLIASCEPQYPRLLAEIEDAPPIISVIGNITHINNRSIGIVGSRNASLSGRRFTEKIAEDLGKSNITTVSGLAAGIDTAAHKGSLKTGTIAVIAGGIDHIYPKENKWLYEKIAEKGAIIAESPIGSKPTARHFPRRNRIISGMSEGVLVIEAAFKSGSLITAREAADQSRDVFAVPGSPLDPRCKGTNNLIRNGAILTENAKDILRELENNAQYDMFLPQKTPKPHPISPQTPQTSPENPQFTPKNSNQSNTEDKNIETVEAYLLDNLSQSAIQLDEIIRDCHFSAQEISVALLQLEMAKKIDRHPGNKISRRFDTAENA